jgi:hypothetical protein
MQARQAEVLPSFSGPTKSGKPTRGQVEGIGTSPRLSVKDLHGAILNSPLGSAVRDGHAAIDVWHVAAVEIDRRKCWA